MALKKVFTKIAEIYDNIWIYDNLPLLGVYLEDAIGWSKRKVGL